MGAANWVARVRAAYAEADVDESTEPLTVDVPPAGWVAAITRARDELGCTFFDWLSAVDESGGDPDGFALVCHLANHRPGGVAHLLLRTRLPRERPVAATVAGVYAGARWHERETHEMFGIDFSSPDEASELLALETLLLPDEFEGHPLRKEFVLASRVAKPWPGAKEPGESDADAGHGAAPGGRTRRKARPPGVPDDWPRGPSDA